MGLLFDGVIAGLRVFVGTIWGGAGKLCTSTELVDSVDLRFLTRVGAILQVLVMINWLKRRSEFAMMKVT
jgi:hypothetical protein